MYRETKDAALKGTLKAMDPFGGSWAGNWRIEPSVCVAWAAGKGIRVPDALAELLDHSRIEAGFQFDPDSDTYPAELDAALIVWRAATRRLDPGRQPKDQILACLEELYPDFPDTSKQRIAIVCNWNKRGGRPKGEA
jgi:hypothetical protein